MKHNVFVPADVPKEEHIQYIKNYEKITNENGNLFLFAGDQKIEHLNEDFVGKNISENAANPRHLFEIAKNGKIGAFATQLGLISRYGKEYPTIPYIAKLNSKTNLIPSKSDDPCSADLWSIMNVLELKENSGLNICGVGYTIYLGSQYENEMLSQAAHAVFAAHQIGLVAILWIYPRSKYIKDENDPKLIAGAAGVAACLGADFVKLLRPKDKNGKFDAKLLQEAVAAAGNTKVICAGGPTIAEDEFLKGLEEQIKIGKTAGFAIGRNIFQKSLVDAVKLTKKINAVIP